MYGRYSSFLPAEAVGRLDGGWRETVCGSFRLASSQPQARKIKFAVRWVAPVRAFRRDFGCNGSQSLYNVLCVVQPPHMRVARRQELYEGGQLGCSCNARSSIAAASPNR